MNDSASRQIAHHEFEVARYRAWLHSISSKLIGKNTHLCLFNLAHCPITDGIDRGVQTIELARIVGTTGRSEDFDTAFRPRVDYIRDRWIDIYMAYTQGEFLPPIALYKFGDHYYVIDGHHRISVMRYHGQTYVEANVIELITPSWN
jgi:hypothetical protein